MFVHAEYQIRIEKLEAEVKERSAQLDSLTSQLETTQAEKSQLTQQVASINSLLEASQNKQDEDSKQVGYSFLCVCSLSVWLLFGQNAEWYWSFLLQQLNPAELEHLKLR